EAKESNLLAVALPSGQTFGPVDTVLEKLSERCLLKYSDLIHIGKRGDTSMISDYFKFGTVSWVDSSTGASCGGYFLATLSSLQF
ncbi:hypothetical protein MKW92_036896, partial [Papaver armeniacum]